MESTLLPLAEEFPKPAAIRHRTMSEGPGQPAPLLEFGVWNLFGVWCLVFGVSENLRLARRLYSVLAATVLVCALTGCRHLPSGRDWGDRALYPVDWKRLPIAAKNAALDPLTWVPLVGAGVIAAGDWDHNISDWASEKNPLFGSIDGAKDFSDVGRSVLVGEAFGTMLLTPSGDTASDWALNKARGAGVEVGAVLITDGATSGLKSATGRERPDGSNDRSMPSAHASAAFAGASLANRNLDYIEMPRYARTGLKAANIALATSVAWARVEGEKHFPTDVLVGASLGNFLTRFIHDGFLGLEPDDRFSFYLEPATDGGRVFLSWEF